MKEKEKKLAISAESAQSGDSKEAEKMTEVSPLSTGEESLDAEDKVSEDEFLKLIEGKYKTNFNSAVKKIIEKRLREVKHMKETAEKNAQLIESLMKKLGIEDNDGEKLERMIDEKMSKGNLNYEKLAEVFGQLISENKRLKEENMQKEEDGKITGIVSEWKKQAEEVKKNYPDFDLKKQMESEEFCRLLRLGVGMKTAYEVLNIEDILDKNSKEAEKMAIDKIRLKGNRPIENGSEGDRGIVLSGNVSKLTKKQRAELAKRAAKGERIEF